MRYSAVLSPFLLAFLQPNPHTYSNMHGCIAKNEFHCEVFGSVDLLFSRLAFVFVVAIIYSFSLLYFCRIFFVCMYMHAWSVYLCKRKTSSFNLIFDKNVHVLATLLLNTINVVTYVQCEHCLRIFCCYCCCLLSWWWCTIKLQNVECVSCVVWEKAGEREKKIVNSKNQ